MNAAEIFREAKSVLESNTWVQGDELTYEGRKRGCYCAATAIWSAFATLHPDKPIEGVFEVINVFKVAVGFDLNTGLGMWNDAPGLTKADVLAGFDQAIALTEEKKS